MLGSLADNNRINFAPIAVHGFEQAQYNVEEGERLVTMFYLNVKGMTQFGGDLVISGSITAEADGSASRQ